MISLDWCNYQGLFSPSMYEEPASIQCEIYTYNTNYILNYICNSRYDVGVSSAKSSLLLPLHHWTKFSDPGLGIPTDR